MGPNHSRHPENSGGTGLAGGGGPGEPEAPRLARRGGGGAGRPAGLCGPAAFSSTMANQRRQGTPWLRERGGRGREPGGEPHVIQGAVTWPRAPGPRRPVRVDTCGGSGPPKTQKGRRSVLHHTCPPRRGSQWDPEGQQGPLRVNKQRDGLGSPLSHPCTPWPLEGMLNGGFISLVHKALLVCSWVGRYSGGPLLSAKR